MRFRIVASIGLPAARLHTLLHTYATLALRNGDDPVTAQNALGHFSAAYTLDQYGHTTTQMQKDSANRMDAAIDGLKRNK